MKPVDLRCEYRENPRGIEAESPKLMWRLDDPRHGAKQTAFQIRVASSRAKLEAGEADLWDCGRVESDTTANVAYQGPPLDSLQQAFWQVQCWDADGVPGEESDIAMWETGLLHRADWGDAEWIGSTLVGSRETSVPCPYLRREFSLDSGVRSARLVITALGLYEATINGRPVDDAVFSPGWTHYRDRVQVQVYDVTRLLEAGDNVLGAVLGDGWYCGHVSWDKRQNYGDRPRLLALLVGELENGARFAVPSDGTWRWTSGPLVESDLLMGESYDARLEMPGWDSGGFDDSDWHPAMVFADPGIVRSPMLGPPVRRQEEILPAAPPTPLGAGTRKSWIFDVGQNIAGRVRLRVREKPGTCITLRHAEMLNADGTLHTANLREARATDIFTAGAGGEQVYEPRFTFHGFRYVEVSGLTGEPEKDTVTGIVLHTDMPEIGTMTTSDERVNQLLSNIRWGQKGNHLDVPTDCPQRNERLGWTGDAWAFVRTAALNMDIGPMYRKWLRDLSDCQSRNGAVPRYAPDVHAALAEDTDGGPAWADAMVFCSWAVYQAYADRDLLEVHYPACARFVDWIAERSIDGIRCHPEYQGFRGFGDWLAPGSPSPGRTPTPRDLIGTAFLKASAELVARMAEVLGKTGDARRYRTLAEETADVFRHTFMSEASRLSGDTQTAYVLALAFDLLPEDKRQDALERLVQCIEYEQDHLSTGFIGTPLLCPVLSRFGRTDVAYRLLMQDTCPSWLYPVKLGATTMWERWDSWTPEQGFHPDGMNSFNHYAYGAIGEWLFATVAGIAHPPEAPGYKRIVFQPQPGNGLTHARGRLRSIHGTIECAWRIDRGALRIKATVPPNTTAEVRLPVSGAVHAVEAGTHEFSEEWPGSA